MRPRFMPACGAIFAWEIRDDHLSSTTYVLLLAAGLLAGWSFSWLVTLLSRGADVALQPGSDMITQFLRAEHISSWGAARF